MKKIPPAFKPSEYQAADITAIQQLYRGEAGEDMQKRALAWLIEYACKTHDLSYRIDPYETAFAEGRRFVGLEILKMLDINPADVRRKQK